MKLSDFINTDNEDEIMEMINKTHKNLSTTILLHLWYENNEISSTDLKKFLIRWEDKLHFKTIVKQTSDVEPHEFVFFDIIPTTSPKNDRYRFKYKYVSNDRIVEGLTELYNCIKFIKQDKPPKRQKRNDYED
tara:strand:+ start:54 stop:452 length:399 start_codon:yes stop_codon:yes gene_type:complete